MCEKSLDGRRICAGEYEIEMVNILIASCGTRNKVVQFFKEAIGDMGRVIATDCSPYAPALYEADGHYIVPRITEEGYIEELFDICKKEQITGILSLIDPELSLLALHSKEFANMGVQVIGSSYELCERTLNKWDMYCWMQEHEYPCAKTYITLEDFDRAIEQGDITYPVFVKPIKGSASLQISKAEDRETVVFLFGQSPNMMIQEYMTGQEIGVDCYIDTLSEEVVSIFAKKKLVMRAGETDKAISFKDEKLFLQVERFVKENGFLGQIDIDIFEKDGVYYFSEVNPRFGGGYPHAYLCGADHMKLIVNNLQGVKNQRVFGKYAADKVMMKYNEIMLTDIK